MAPTSGRGIDSVSPAFVTRRTLADAAVDGLVPEAKLASPELMLEEAKRALAVWIERVANGENWAQVSTIGVSCIVISNEPRSAHRDKREKAVRDGK